MLKVLPYIKYVEDLVLGGGDFDSAYCQTTNDDDDDDDDTLFVSIEDLAPK